MLARHGETEWSISGRHTGVSEIPLTEKGRAMARQLRARLVPWDFAAVWSSPRIRARETCELAGFGERLEIVPDIAEWRYGEYEGKTTAEIRETRPLWSVWSDGPLGGETAEQIGARADRAILRLRGLSGDALLFSHAHFLRVLTARWVGLAPQEGRCFALATGSVSVLGWEREAAVVELWNDHDRVRAQA